MSDLKFNKGTWGGTCNRTACKSEEHARWYNRSTRKYYCEDCARLINRMNPEGTIGHGIVNPMNKFDSFEPGEPLCVFVETIGA